MGRGGTGEGGGGGGGGEEVAAAAVVVEEEDSEEVAGEACVALLCWQCAVCAALE